MFELVGSDQIMLMLMWSVPGPTVNVTGCAAFAPCAGSGSDGSGAETCSLSVDGVIEAAGPSVRNVGVTVVGDDEPLNTLNVVFAVVFSSPETSSCVVPDESDGAALVTVEPGSF